MPWLYQEKGLYINYFIPCHRKYSGQHNQCDICTVHDGKAGWNTIEYKMAFLYSYLLCYCRCTFRHELRCTTHLDVPHTTTVYSKTNGLCGNSHVQLVALNNLFFCFCMSCAWTCFSSLHAHSCSSLILAVLSNSEFSFCIKRHFSLQLHYWSQWPESLLSVKNPTANFTATIDSLA